LAEVDQMKSHFFTNISHEFRTPLTLILGPASQILENTENNEVKEEAKLIYRSATKLNKLANQLLDLSKIESGNMKLKTVKQNLTAFMDEIVSSFRSFAESKNISLKYNPEQDDIILYLDRDKMDKILSNIISNALKFTPGGGSINIDVKTKQLFSLPLQYSRDEFKEGFVEITITDTGIGIPAEQIDKIFDMFYQVNHSVAKEYEGVGVGLSLTKELVEIHKGKIIVESEEGRGATFKIFIPLGDKHLQPGEIAEEMKEDEVESGEENFQTTEIEEPFFVKEKTNGNNVNDSSKKEAKPSLLIIEDNADVRKYIFDILKNYYEISEASDGEEGLKKSFEQIPDLIISDIMMPKMDGLSLCDKLKTDSRTSHIPVILLTAKSTLQDKVEGLETGADDYIMKPFEAVELKARIKNLLIQRKRIHRYFKEHGLFEIEEKKVTPVDQKFIKKAVELINDKISDPGFNVEKFAENMAISRSLLHKKLIALIGEPPGELIKRIRLDRAAKMIIQNSGNITEIAFEVGFNDPSYFAACFKKQFGKSPSQYQHS